MKTTRFLLAAIFGLALAFTISCGEHSLDDQLNDSSSSRTPARSSSSSSNLVVSSSSSLARSSSGASLQSSSGKNAIVYGKTITDSRDGQTYETVVIGTQTWMAKNLNLQAEGAKCYGEGTRMFSADSIARNCEIYGRLYSWETAMSACPEGWHLPYYAEWKQLVDYAGTDYRTKLMAASSDYWAIATFAGTDDYGFSGLPGGIYSDREFSFIYYSGEWWSTTERTPSGAHYMNTTTGIAGAHDKSSLLSVRCVQGPPGCTPVDNTDTQYCLGESGTMKNYGSMTDKGGKTYKTVVIGEQTWMAENLDYEVEFSKCYDNKPENCEKYGRLYDWLAATEVCPSGWHLPSEAEWKTFTEVAPKYYENNSLRARSRVGAVDRYGFSAIGGGRGRGSSFYDVADDYWWSATEYDASKAIGYGGSSSFNYASATKTDFYSVRCLKD